MPGGLLNIVAYGNQNVILNGNPSKTFFKAVYAKYTNFGMQKFRIDFNGQRNLRLNEESKFTFKMPRYAELLLDSYLVINLPNIWSPIYPPQNATEEWKPYEFKWIKNLGALMIKKVTISVGGATLQEYTGEYLYNLVERDYSESKKKMFYEMTGNVSGLNSPGNTGARVNQYPNSFYNTTVNGSEPSIRGRKLYVPISPWFSHSSKMAFPMVSMQYNELFIEVTLRPIKELFLIRDVPYETYIQPNFNEDLHQMYRFLQPPPSVNLKSWEYEYTDVGSLWNADVHLISTYCFLSAEESKVFALNEQKYLIKDIHEYIYYNIVGTKRLEIKTMGMVSNWMLYLKRSDAELRNEWTNYSNWPYDYLPYEIDDADVDGSNNMGVEFNDVSYGPGINPTDDTQTGLFITGDFQVANQKEILQRMAIIFDGKYRENELDAGIYKYIEKYSKSDGGFCDGVYYYNYCLETAPNLIQPSGAVNLSKFKKIELEISTFIPPLDASAQSLNICSEDGSFAGSNKNSWNIYDYTYTLKLFEERYNILHFSSGNVSLVYAR
tara:strand:- start:103 stop:1755 length:1653 start_codon:yes stop_codon:yes gene_type:complete